MADQPHLPQRRFPEGVVCTMVRVEARPGEAGEVARILRELSERVRGDEPACLTHFVTRGLGSQNCFAIHASYADWTAFKAHAETPHMNHVLPRLNALLACPLSMEIFLEVEHCPG